MDALLLGAADGNAVQRPRKSLSRSAPRHAAPSLHTAVSHNLYNVTDSQCVFSHYVLIVVLPSDRRISCVRFALICLQDDRGE